jgi:hypothetical protein
MGITKEGGKRPSRMTEHAVISPSVLRIYGTFEDKVFFCLNCLTMAQVAYPLHMLDAVI